MPPRKPAPQASAQPALTEKTPVIFTVPQILMVSVAIISSAVGITWQVAGKISDVDKSLRDNGAQLAANTATLERHSELLGAQRVQLDAIKSSLEQNAERDKERDTASSARLAAWTPWSWSVTRDLLALGKKANVEVETKTHPQPKQ